jgi:hypothetical protein
MRLWAIVAVLAGLGLTQAAGASPSPAIPGSAPSAPSPEKRAEAEQFAVNNSLSALYHEFGHLFIDQFQLPILGHEEDAADAISTLLLLKENSDQSAEVSYDTVDGYFMSSDLYGEAEGGNVDFADEHALDVQRAYEMACLLVGGNPAEFEGLADDVGLGAERIEACGDEYATAQRGWDAMMAAHLRNGGPEGAAITVVYEPAGTIFGQVATLLKARRVLEQVADAVRGQFVLKSPVTLRAKLCDAENAFYNGEAGEITLCYEYARFYYDLIFDPARLGFEE